jgi:hypothetical protein
MNHDKSHIQFYAFIRFKLGKSAAEVEDDIRAVLPDKCPTRRTIYRWFQDFNSPEFALGDAARSGRPCSTRTAETIAVVRDLITEDPRQSVRELADCMEIDFKTVHRILTEDLHLRNVCSVWVPHDLTADQCQARVNCAKQIRKVFFSRGIEKILNCLAVEDETWLHLEGKGSKADNRCWLGAGDSRPTVTRRSISEKKTMLLVAFTPNKRVSICTTPPNTKVDGQFMIDFIRHTGDLWRTLRSNPIHLDEVLWQMDNARPHSCRAVTDFLATRQVEQLWQSPYSPDFNLCDRFLFKWLKEDFSKRSFADHNEVKEAALQWFRQLDEKHLHTEVERLYEHCQKVIDARGAYIVE